MAASRLPVQAASVEAFDGRSNLICTVQQLFECDSYAGCRAVAEDVAYPIRHLDLDLGKRTVKIEHLDSNLTSPISRTEVLNGKLILQGTDAGLNGGAERRRIYDVDRSDLRQHDLDASPARMWRSSGWVLVLRAADDGWLYSRRRRDPLSLARCQLCRNEIVVRDVQQVRDATNRVFLVNIDVAVGAGKMP